MPSDRAFEAPDLIEVMDEAVRYNAFLLDELEAWAQGAAPLLDFGAGNGRFSGALRKRDLEVHAVEPDARLREKIEAKGVKSYESLDALGEQRFGGVYSLNVLEHLEDDQGVLEGFQRSLRSGGKLFLYVPAFESIFSANDERVGHLRRYRKDPLVRQVEAAGFTVERATYVDCIGFFAALAYRFVGNSDGDLSIRSVRFYDRFLFPLSRLLDSIFGRVLGKNLLVSAFKPAAPDSPSSTPPKH